ncbi:MAG: hypothetical protein M1817_003287 [Caeruleum heppii]|nr:MAG: hypothetical protein M1817_003287 [Caeruleum heppii]
MSTGRRARPPLPDITVPVREPAVVSSMSPMTPSPRQRHFKMGFRALFQRNSKSVKPSKETQPRTSPPTDHLSPLRRVPPTEPEPAFSQTTVSTTTNLPRDVDSPPKAVNRRASRSVVTPKSSKQSCSRWATIWDPPPLFQAYPQSVKHAVLEASTVPADTILRSQNQKDEVAMRQNSMRSMVDISETGTEETKREPAKLKHKRRLSSTTTNMEWTSKIYVLITSGFILQYAGDGPHDRLPEKMLQLRRDSVAFASDVIPGKHWVLQISQSSDEGTVVTETSRHRFSKLSFRGTSRRATNNLLLVLDSAEEMDAWMSAIRREVDALGGNEEAGENPNRGVTDRGLEKRPSQRYLVVRDPNKYSLPRNAPAGSPDADFERCQRGDGTDAGSISSKRFSSIRPPLSTPSTATTRMSDDQMQLDRLREGSRLSYISTGTWTLPTSQGSSPGCSPTQDSFDEKLSRSPPSLSHKTKRQSTSGSLQREVIRTPEDSPPTPKAVRPRRSHSPPIIKNFAVPTKTSTGLRTSKRYSNANVPPIPRVPSAHSLIRSGSKPTGLRQPSQTVARSLSRTGSNASSRGGVRRRSSSARPRSRLSLLGDSSPTRRPLTVVPDTTVTPDQVLTSDAPHLLEPLPSPLTPAKELLPPFTMTETKLEAESEQVLPVPPPPDRMPPIVPLTEPLPSPPSGPLPPLPFEARPASSDSVSRRSSPSPSVLIPRQDVRRPTSAHHVRSTASSPSPPRSFSPFHGSQKSTSTTSSFSTASSRPPIQHPPRSSSFFPAVCSALPAVVVSPTSSGASSPATDRAPRISRIQNRKSMPALASPRSKAQRVSLMNQRASRALFAGPPTMPPPAGPLPEVPCINREEMRSSSALETESPAALETSSEEASTLQRTTPVGPILAESTPLVEKPAPTVVKSVAKPAVPAVAPVETKPAEEGPSFSGSVQAVPTFPLAVTPKVVGSTPRLGRGTVAELIKKMEGGK